MCFDEKFDENDRTDIKIGIFPISIAYWSGLGTFKQNRGNPNDIGMVGQYLLLIDN